MADVSEKIQRMEKELREATSRHDRCAAELQVRYMFISLLTYLLIRRIIQSIAEALVSYARIRSRCFILGKDL